MAVLCVSTRTLLAAGGESADLAKLGLFFVKVGSVLYGSGYVPIAFLEGGLIDDCGWVTRQQLLDAVAAGQFTLGPVLTTATFLGPGRRPFTSEASAEALLQANIVSRCHPEPEPWPPSSARGSVGEAPRSSAVRWGEFVFHRPKTRLLCFKPASEAW